MSKIALSEEQKSWLAEYNIDQPTWIALCNSVYPGAQPASIVMVHEYCKARGLDPLKKPVHIVPMQVTDARNGNKEWRDVVMPGIAEHRITAMRTGLYAGMDDPVYGEPIDYKGVTAPEFIRVTVYRMINGVRVPFPHVEYFTESVQTKSSGEVNKMWTRRPRGQLLKCAEAGALRKAFPEELGGEITAEEALTMEAGEKIINSIPDEGIKDPSRKSAQTQRGHDGLIDNNTISVINSKLEILSVEPIKLLNEFGISSLNELKAEQMTDVFAWIEGAAQ
jgi:phage recombination protein Bet